jgi:hypothetical protein
MKSIVENFADYYIEQGFTDFNAFDLADIISDAMPDLTRMELHNLVCECEDVIKAKIGYVSPFAHLVDAADAWSPK